MIEERLPCTSELVIEYERGRMSHFSDSSTTISSVKSSKIVSHANDKGQINLPKQPYHYRNRSRKFLNFPYLPARKRGSQWIYGNRNCSVPVRAAITSKYKSDIELVPYRKEASNLLPDLAQSSQVMQKNKLNLTEAVYFPLRENSLAGHTKSLCRVSVDVISQENPSSNESDTVPSLQHVENQNLQKSSINLPSEIFHFKSCSSDVSDKGIQEDKELPEQLSLERDIGRILGRESRLRLPSFSKTYSEFLEYHQVPEEFQENLGSEMDHLLTVNKKLLNQKQDSGRTINCKQVHLTEIQSIDTLGNLHQFSDLPSSVTIPSDTGSHSDDGNTDWETIPESSFGHSPLQHSEPIEHETKKDSKNKQPNRQKEDFHFFHPRDTKGLRGDIVLDRSGTRHDSFAITSQVSIHSHDTEQYFMQGLDSYKEPKIDENQPETLKPYSQDHAIKRLLAAPKMIFSLIASRNSSPSQNRSDSDHIKSNSQGSTTNSKQFDVGFVKDRGRNLLQRFLKHTKNKSLQLSFQNNRYKTPQNGSLGDLSIPLHHSYEGLLSSTLVCRNKVSETSSDFFENGRREYLDLMASFADNECIIAYYEDGPRIFSRRKTQSAHNRESRRTDTQIKFDVVKVNDLVISIAGEFLYPDFVCDSIRSSRVAFETSRTSGPSRYLADFKLSVDKQEDNEKKTKEYNRLSQEEAEQFIDFPGSFCMGNLRHHRFSRTVSRKKSFRFPTSKLTRVHFGSSKKIFGHPLDEQHQTSNDNFSMAPGLGDDYPSETERADSRSQIDRHIEPCNVDMRINAKLISVALLLFCFVLPPVLFPIYFSGGFDFLISFLTKGKVPRCNRAQKRWALWASFSSLIVVMAAAVFVAVWWILAEKNEDT